ncbi:SIP domain-containing protein [Nocardioides alcanivorans]|uniref:SIP domain-containing protein n=1 Tax=Nocardioides alcanivorans TaxID=2897352 RepID=UPI001F3BC1E5|nr:SIP domain-containing protein [Nocardioides alcanivorans]
MARIAESVTDVPVRIWAEVPDEVADYLPEGPAITWLDAESGTSHLSDAVETIEWPDGEGYFWMAGSPPRCGRSART